MFYKREFVLDGKTAKEQYDNLVKHIDSRILIIDVANAKKYNFGAGKDFKMNPEFWTKDAEGNHLVVKGKSIHAAYLDMFWENAKKYCLGCKMATLVTLHIGTSFNHLVDSEVEEDDWIPGDAGFIENINFEKGKWKAGYEGENIIYMGNGLYWGHFTNVVKNKKLDKGDDSWFGLIKRKFHSIDKSKYGDPKIKNTRRRSNVGFKKTQE